MSEEPPYTVINGKSFITIKVSAQNYPQAAELVDFLRRLEKSVNARDASVVVEVPETVFHRFLPQLREQGYKFRNYDEGLSVFTYYKLASMKETGVLQPIPVSVDIFAALVTTGDSRARFGEETHVLLVKKNVIWELITFPIGKKEAPVDQLVQYLRKNFALETDEDSRLAYVGGWYNDNFFESGIHARLDCIKIRMKNSGSVLRGGPEVEEMKWIPKEEAIAILKGGGVSEEPHLVSHEGQFYNRYHMGLIKHICSHPGFPVTFDYSKDKKKRIMFFGVN